MKPENLKVYKIRNAAGKYSRGGMACDSPGCIWTSKGKVWVSFGAIKGHLRQYISVKYSSETKKSTCTNNIPKDWVVIEISVGGIKEFSARECYPETWEEK